MKAEVEEALGHLQEAARSYMHAAKQCKLDGESANQTFAQRARDVLGKPGSRSRGQRRAAPREGRERDCDGRRLAPPRADVF